MNKITFPLKPGDSGPAVADLQSGLRLLIDKDFYGFNPQQAEAARGRLAEEAGHNRYAGTTKDLVARFEKLSGLNTDGLVDAAAAEALNKQLDRFGAFDTTGSQPPEQRLVAGQVCRESGEAIPGVPVRAFHVGDGGVLRLGSDTTDPDGGFTIPYTIPPGIPAIQLRVVAYQDNKGVADSGVLADVQAVQFVNLTVSAQAGSGEPRFAVAGQVASPSSAGVGGLTVHLVDKGVGGDFPLAETTTDANGAYAVTFGAGMLRSRGKQQPDLQARVFRGDAFLAASAVHYNAGNQETIDVELADGVATTLASEHEALTSSLALHFTGPLAGLQENDERQDISYLSNKAGWDARAVVFATVGERLSAAASQAGQQIEPPFFYALFRAGLPTDENALYSLDSQAAAQIWQEAIAQGLIPAGLQAQLPSAQEAFQKMVASRALSGPPAAGLSPLKDLLAISLTPSGGPQGTQEEQIADIITRHRDDPEAMWQAIEQDLGADVEARMRVDGKLARLTGSNAALMAKLHGQAPGGRVQDPGQLVQLGYYQAAKWQDAVTGLPVPPEIPGADDAEKRARYADLLATEVRLSYPTTTVAEMVLSKETPLLDASGTALPDNTLKAVHDFLAAQAGKFQINMQPVEQYARQNNVTLDPAVSQQITRIQRVMQITPSDQAMNALLAHNIDSANKVVQYGRDEFVAAFKDAAGGEAQAGLIHARARQVHAVALNLVTAYGAALAAPGIGTGPAGGTPRIINAAPDGASTIDSGVLAMPTLESLFGGLDFCDCEHCRSMLSPAAYLVDLLRFVDRDDDVWAAFLSGWKADHGNSPYPFERMEDWTAAGQPAGTEITPLQVLLGRRPDLQHLPLTCENTNTPLPYIDLVNETLESYVANGSLTDYEGHTTDGSASAEELLANPQFVQSEAYTVLAASHFPPPLPFDQRLEAVRRYLDRSGAALPAIMEALRTDEAIERASDDAYGWRDILMEELRLSREEYRLLTDSSLPLQDLYGFPAGTSPDDVLAALSGARTFTRRMGISYDELLQVLRTRFVNPASALLPRLERLGVSFGALKQLKDCQANCGDIEAQFEASLAPQLDPADYGGDILAWVRDDANYNNIMSLLTLEDPSGGEAADCSFETLQFRYADPARIAESVKPLEFVRLLRFIRLWRKLGWTIEATDKAITAFYPPEQTPAPGDTDAAALAKLDAGFLVLLPRLGVLVPAMRALRLNPNHDLLQSLALFGPLDTHGEASLYRQLFLRTGAALGDAAFAGDAFGNFLTDANAKLLDHAETIRAAFGLTAQELGLIADSLGYDVNTGLTVDNVSAIFRRGFLARTLKLSVAELLLLSEYAGLDPFTAPDPPGPPLLRLLELLRDLKRVSLKPAQALYLVWNQDVSGKSAPKASEMLDFARNLRLSLAAIDREFAIVDDPGGQIARVRMTLVYGRDATDLFFSLLDRTFNTEVTYDHTGPVLEQPILDAAPGQIGYDDFRKRLSFKGLMTGEVRDALKNASAGASFQGAVDALFTANHAALDPFFARYPDLRTLHDGYFASSQPDEAKRSALLAQILPDLILARKQQQAAQALAAAAGASLELTQAVLDNKPRFTAPLFGANPAAVYVLHAGGDPTRPALDDLVAAQTPGLSAQFFLSDHASGAPGVTRPAEANLAYHAGSNPLPENTAQPGSPISATWSGYLEAPEDDFYNLFVETEPGATVTLTVDDAPVALQASGGSFSNSQPVELHAGRLYPIVLTVENVKADLAVTWETRSRGRKAIPAASLYPSDATDALSGVYVRFLKAASLASALKLEPDEFAYLAAYPLPRVNGQGWLNELPVASRPAAQMPAELPAVLDALLDFATMKAAFGGEDGALLGVLRDPAASAQPPGPGADAVLFSLTRWEPASLTALLARFGKTLDDLADVAIFKRVYEAMAPVKQMGIAAGLLIAAATNVPKPETVATLQSAMRARFSEADWLKLLKPINDELRGLQRDALVAHILNGMAADPATRHIDTPDKLFESFLMDVQMEPCMETSRVRHALSSIQLFIERCLMNLEPGVSPSVLNAGEWEWMSRYRVWEANRKVFLFPENWLEPELRDDQSPIFKEAMGELLQGDITQDSAEIALLNYLAKLDRVAKLEPCGIYYEEDDLSTEATDDVIHVVARTAGAHREYYYACRRDGSWTPWDQIRLEIEDNPVIPVIWKDRLLLFWLKITQQALLTAPSVPAGPLVNASTSTLVDRNSNQVVGQAVLCWSEYYNGKWQPVRTSDLNNPASLGSYDASEAAAFRQDLRLSSSEAGGALKITIRGARRTIRIYPQKFPVFTLYNTHSLPVLAMEPAQGGGEGRQLDTSGDALTITYTTGTSAEPLVRRVVNERIADGSEVAVMPQHALAQPWDAPFLFADARHAFLVTTAERVVHFIDWGGFVNVGPAQTGMIALPRLVQREPLIPERAVPVGGDPSPVEAGANLQRFVTEDAFIRRGIAVSEPVTFDGATIGPAGRIVSNGLKG